MTAPLFPERNGKRVSSLEVARLAGVSRATVSRCFTRDGMVREATRQRVLKAARDLGYEPNFLARMLNKQESSIVAVVTSDFANPFQPALMEALSESIRSRGFIPLLLKANSVLEPADPLIQLSLSYRVAAIVVTVLNASREMIARSFEAGVPIIFLNRIPEETDAIAICSNGKSGAYRLADVLVHTKHTRIGMLTGRVDSWSNSVRRSGFRQRLDERDYDVVASVKGDFTYEGGYHGTLALLRDSPRLDAIYACNDVMAFGALDALRENTDRRVPEDVSVVGFDDVPMAAWGAYRLSTMRQPVKEMLQQTSDILASPDRGMGLSGQTFLHDGHFVQRNTTEPTALLDGEQDDSYPAANGR